MSRNLIKLPTDELLDEVGIRTAQPWVWQRGGLVGLVSCKLVQTAISLIKLDAIDIKVLRRNSLSPIRFFLVTSNQYSDRISGG
jgi:hypothetical protein